MDDPEDILFYSWVWFIGWLITSNLILFSLGYKLHDFHMYFPIWLIAFIICFTIYPVIPIFINILLKNPKYKIKILFNFDEDYAIWYFFVGPFIHGVTSLIILLSYANLEGNLGHMYLGGDPSLFNYNYDTTRMYIFYGVLYPLIWSISAIFWFFIIPIIITFGNWIYERNHLKSKEVFADNSNLIPSKKDMYINFSFSKYDLSHYDSFIDLLNKSSFFDDFYRLFPVLLRCLFENLLYDIYVSSLHNSHKELYFLKDKNRARDFSQLIHLLNLLKDIEFKPYIRDLINQKTIEILTEIQKMGNYTVHDVIRKVTKEFPLEWKERINLILETLLISYKKLKNINLKIDNDEREEKIKDKLGIN